MIELLFRYGNHTGAAPRVGLLMATGNLPARRKPTKSDSSSGTTRAVIRTVADGYRFVRTREPGFIAGAATGAMYTADAYLWGPAASPTLAVTGATAACMTRYWTSSPHAKRNREMRRIGQVLVSYDIKQPSGQAPRMKNFVRTPAGKRVDIKLPKQTDAIVFEKLLLGLENDFRAEVRVARIEPPKFGPLAAVGSTLSKTSQKASRGSGVRPVSDRVARGGVRLTIVERDTLAQALTSPWPVLEPREIRAADGSVRREIPARRWNEPLPVAMDEDGERVDLSFAKRPSILIAGESGSGKSVFTHEVVDGWILDPRSDLMLWDGKGMLELNRYTCLTGGQIVGPDLGPAMRQLSKLIDELTRREKSLYDRGLEEASADDPECPPLLAVIEEFTAYRDAEFFQALMYLLVRVRVVNIRILLTVQRPSAKTMPTDIRDNIGMRVCHSMLTSDGSDMALGDGWAKRGWNAQSIPMDDKGTFAGINLLLNDGGVPRRTRSWFVDAGMRTAATRRALELRGLPTGWADLRGAALARAVGPRAVPSPRSAGPVRVVEGEPVSVAKAAVAAPSAGPVVDAEAARRAHNAGQMQARRGRKRPPRAERAVATPGALNTSSSER